MLAWKKDSFIHYFVNVVTMNHKLPFDVFVENIKNNN